MIFIRIHRFFCIFAFTLVIYIPPSIASDDLLKNFRYAERSECSEVRIDGPGTPMSKVPVFDQGDLPICWAHTAATLISTWQTKNSSSGSITVSPTSLSLSYSHKAGRKNLRDQDSPLAILRSANGLSVCQYADFPDYFESKSAIKFLVELIDPFIDVRKGRYSVDSAIQKINTALAGTKSKYRINKQDFLELDGHGPSSSVLYHLTNKMCDEKLVIDKIPIAKLQSVSRYKSPSEGVKKLRELVDLRLDLREQNPTGITICFAALETKDVLALGENGRLDESKCKIGNQERSNHFVVIVGRRLAILKDEGGSIMKDGRGREITMCQYLVRDSYGTSCNGYSDEPRLNPSDRCEKGTGQVWVDEDTLFTNTSQAFYLADK